MNDIILNKKVSMERCIKQILDYHAMETSKPFEVDYLKQDAIAMNLQRMSEIAIDIASYLVRKKKLGLPQDSGDTFVLLHRAGLISTAMMKSMKGMTGFRNVLVHEYQQVSLKIMVDIIEHHLREPLDFANLALKLMA